jgi:hypothetical protein
MAALIGRWAAHPTASKDKHTAAISFMVVSYMELWAD